MSSSSIWSACVSTPNTGMSEIFNNDNDDSKNVRVFWFFLHADPLLSSYDFFCNDFISQFIYKQQTGL